MPIDSSLVTACRPRCYFRQMAGSIPYQHVVRGVPDQLIVTRNGQRFKLTIAVMIQDVIDTGGMQSDGVPVFEVQAVVVAGTEKVQ